MGCPMRSDVTSAGVLCLRQPGGDKDVLRGIDVPIMSGTAVGARPMTCPEGQRGEQVPARATGLGAGIPAVDHRDTTASQLGLVFEHGAELAPTAFADRLGQR